MTTDNTLNATVSMWGKGDYSLNTRGAKDVIDNALDLVLAALGDLEIEGSSRPFNIADYGAADGGTSMDLMTAVIDAIRRRDLERPICVTYTDLPRNDYCALFSMLQGNRAGIKSYVEEHDGVYPYATATSFFKSIFPDQTIDFGFSATAMHWLSAVPCPISDHIHAVGASGHELEAFRARALQDWDTILLRRARELRSGARMVMVNLAIDDQGRHMGNTGGVHMFDTMNELWRKLADDGVITDAEYRDTNIPQFYKTLDEFCAPLRQESSPAYRAGLRLESVHTRMVRCPYAEAFERDGDVTAFAKSYVPTTRTWSETVFRNALDKRRAAEECQAIVDRYFQSFVDLVRQNPRGHGMDYIHTYMVVSRV